MFKKIIIIGKKRLLFYVASNADEANASSFLVNLLSNYELSYNAIFKEGSLRPIVMGTNLVPGDIMTSKDGGIPSYTFIVQAEDRTVETEYFVNIIITAPKTCSEIIDLRVNGGVNYAVHQLPILLLLISVEELMMMLPLSMVLY